MVHPVAFRYPGSKKIGNLCGFIDHSTPALLVVSHLSSSLGSFRRQEGNGRHDLVLGLGRGAGQGSSARKRFHESEGDALDLSTITCG